MRRIPLLLITSVIVLGCITAHRAFSQDVSRDTLIRTIDQIVKATMAEGDIPGVTLVMLQDNRQIIRSYGYADQERRTAITPETIFQLGSCSKAFTALAVLKLAQGNSIRLDAAVGEYLPWFTVTYEGTPVPVTLRQVLHHTTGIPWQTISAIPADTSVHALENTVRGLVGQELNAFPGEVFEYATIHYDILALIIEKVTGAPFEAYIQKNVFNKLALHHTAIGRAADSTLMASGYKIGFFRARPYKAPVFKGNNAAGYVTSNGEDVSRWLRFQMGLIDSDLYTLAKASQQRDETVALHDMSAYAMGWNVSLSGKGEIFHGGVNPNYTAYMAFRPERKLAVAVLANSNSEFTPRIAEKVMALLAGDREREQFEYGPHDGGDKLYSVLCIFTGLYITAVLAFILLIARDVVKGRRGFERWSWHTFLGAVKTVVLLLPFCYGIYILPQAMAGFTWTSIVVWIPISFSFFIVLLLAALAVSCVAFFISLCFPETDPFRRIAPRITLISVLSGVCNLLVIVMVTSALHRSENSNLWYLVYYYVLIVCLYLAGRRFVQINLIRFTSNLVYELRVKLVTKIFSTSYQKFEKIDRGRVYTALNDDVGTIGDSMRTFVVLITNVITALGAFIYLGFIAFWVAVLTIVLIASISVVYYIVSRSTRIYFEHARDARNVFMRLTNGMIDGFKEISLHANKKRFYQDDVANSADEFRNKNATADIKFVNAFMVGESMLVCLLGIVAFAIPKFFPGIKFNVVASFVMVLLYLIGPINAILSAMPAIMRLRVAWNRVQQFLEEIPANLESGKAAVSTTQEIESFKAVDLKFRYENGDVREAFEVGPINLEVKRGEILFIIGGNGSGKTTLAKLLTGLYEPHEGTLLIDNEVVPAAHVSEYFSVIFSPSYLFEKLYNIDATQKLEEINKYLKVLNMDSKVKISNNRFDTIDLSGGQRKRLALLQCYLENSPIYLFDEWAADQDPDYRHFFYRTLLPEMKKMGKIVIAITHDDHYFDAADVVLKMKQGKLEAYTSDIQQLQVL